MAPNASSRIPSYRLHKPTGLAVVRLHGHDLYLGKHGTPASRDEYKRVIAEWLAGGQRVMAQGPTVTASMGDTGLTIDALFVSYWRFAESYYKKNGQPTGEQQPIRQAMKPLIALYSGTPVNEFGPLALKAVRQKMVDAGLCRNQINARVNRIRRMFKWGVENQLIAANVLHALQAVSPLKRGRSEARESEPVRPVPEANIEAVLVHANRQVVAMVKLERLTGMRPGEVTIIRGIDLDTTGRIWIYKPRTHKTDHHGRQRLIYLGPRSQQIIKPFLKPDLEGYLFSPKDVIEELNQRRRKERKSPMTPSQAKRKRKARPHKTQGDRYTTVSYGRAIAQACRKACPPPEHLRPAVLPGGRYESDAAFFSRLTDQEKAELKAWHRAHRWSPNQLRHSTATFIRKEYGIDAARVILGHSSPAVTEVYAELDHTKAMQIMGEVG